MDSMSGVIRDVNLAHNISSKTSHALADTFSLLERLVSALLGHPDRFQKSVGCRHIDHTRPYRPCKLKMH